MRRDTCDEGTTQFSKDDVIVSPECMPELLVKFRALPPREIGTWIPREYFGPPEWWFRFGLHYVLMAAIGAAWLGCLFLAIFFLSGGLR